MGGGVSRNTHETNEFDAITLEILWSRILSIANQGAATLLRTAFSSVIFSSQDFRFVICDAQGTALAQSDLGEPMFVTTFPASVRALLREFPPSAIVAGDVFITNDPWLASGHLPDIHITTPVFHRGRLVAFVGSVIHVSDIGGRFGPHDAVEVFEEGLCLPIMKLYRRGELVPEIFRILEANVRAPDLQIGDIKAQQAANEVAASLLVEFMEEYGLTDLAGLSEAVQGRVEAAMRAAIRAIPDGVLEHESVIDGFDEDLRIRSRITVAGDSLTVDYTGSSPQSATAGVNCVLNCTHSQTLYSFKAILLPHLPPNEGAVKPIRIIAPEGSIFNPHRPAAVDARATVTHLLTDHLMVSLSRVVPDLVLAENGTRWILIADRAPAGGKRRITSFFLGGAMAGSARRDGLSVKFFPTKSGHTPAELFERETHILVEARELLPDSAGAGKHRGGFSQRVVLRNVGRDKVDFLFYRPRIRYPARGLFGGGDGTPGRILVNGAPPAKGLLTLRPGDRAELLTPGAAGYGDPRERRPEDVIRDVRSGLVSPERARLDYGVVVDPESGTRSVEGGA